MEENVNLQNLGEPQPLEEGLPSEEPTAISDEDKTDSAFLEVKFNKELKKLSLEEATTYAQKGMKFDLLAGELETLKALSAGKGVSLPEFVKELAAADREKRLSELTEKCSGDTALAERLLIAEKGEPADDTAELLKEFPSLTRDTVPDSVKTAAKLKGTGLLFEYLLYDHRQRVAAAEEKSRDKAAREGSLGSMSFGSSENLTDAEFIKGIWEE